MAAAMPARMWATSAAITSLTAMSTAVGATAIASVRRAAASVMSAEPVRPAAARRAGRGRHPRFPDVRGVEPAADGRLAAGLSREDGGESALDAGGRSSAGPRATDPENNDYFSGGAAGR